MQRANAQLSHNISASLFVFAKLALCGARKVTGAWCLWWWCGLGNAVFGDGCQNGDACACNATWSGGWGQGATGSQGGTVLIRELTLWRCLVPICLVVRLSVASISPHSHANKQKLASTGGPGGKDAFAKGRGLGLRPPAADRGGKASHQTWGGAAAKVMRAYKFV